jgi:hypothetical protein
MVASWSISEEKYPQKNRGPEVVFLKTIMTASQYYADHFDLPEAQLKDNHHLDRG